MSVKLLDTLKAQKKLKTDVALADLLDVHPPVISKVRKGRLPVGASMILAIHEKLGMPVSDIRRLMAK